MRTNDIVYYLGEECEIIYLYESGYCEIKRPRRLYIELVHLSEISSISNINGKETHQ